MSRVSSGKPSINGRCPFLLLFESALLQKKLRPGSLGVQILSNFTDLQCSAVPVTLRIFRLERVVFRSGV